MTAAAAHAALATQHAPDVVLPPGPPGIAYDITVSPVVAAPLGLLGAANDGQRRPTFSTSPCPPARRGGADPARVPRLARSGLSPRTTMDRTRRGNASAVVSWYLTHTDTHTHTHTFMLQQQQQQIRNAYHGVQRPSLHTILLCVLERGVTG